MKVRCIDINGKMKLLTVGKVYKTSCSYNSTAYYIENDLGKQGKYNKKHFEIVEEKEMIKIKKWQDLRKVKNENYRIEVYENQISIHTNKEICSVFLTDTTPKEIALSILSQFGFEVEFVEVVKLSKFAKDATRILKFFDFHYVTKNKEGQIKAWRKHPKDGIDTSINLTMLSEYLSNAFNYIDTIDYLCLDDLEV